MASRFWVGGTASWDSTAGTKWATTSGGAGGAAVPTSSDDVLFDASSGSGTVTLGADATMLTFTATGYTGTLNFGGFRFTVSGSTCTFATGMALSGSLLALTTGTTGTLTLTSAGKTLPGGVTIQGGGGLALADAINATGSININSNFTTNNFSVTCGTFACSGSLTRTLTLGSSAISVTGTGISWNAQTTTNLTVAANTAIATISGADATFRGGINWNGMSLVFTGSGAVGSDSTGTITVANFTRTGTAVKTDSLSFVGNLTATSTLTLNSNSNVNRLLFQSSTAGTARTITAASVVISNTVDFMDITAAGTATWTVAGTGATYLGDAGGNSGITFTSGITCYWFCDTGVWSDVTHWLGATGPTWSLGGTGGNLLGANQSSLETDTTGWNGAFQCTFARSTAWSSAGTASLALTATVANYMDAKTDFIAVTAGTSYVAFATFRAATVARNVYLMFRWYNSLNNQIGGDVSASTTSTVDSTTGDVVATVSGTAPTGAVNVRIVTVVPNAPVNEVHYVDKVGLYATTAARVPLPQDSVRFDANSFSNGSQAVSSDMPRFAKDIDWTGVTNTPQWAAPSTSISIFGSVTWSSSMTRGTWSATTTYRGRGTHVLTTAGIAQNGTTITASGGTYTLADSFTCTSGTFNVTQGTFSTANFTMTLSAFASTGATTRSIVVGTSTINLTSTAAASVCNLSATALTLSAASATFIISTVSSNTRTFAGAGQTFGTLNYTVASSTGALVISGSNTFSSINVSNGSRTLTLPSSTTTSVSNFNVFGSTGALVTVNSSTPGTTATLSKASGTVMSNYLSLQDSAATGGATWYAGGNSVDVSNNSGWLFTTNTNVTSGFMTFFR